MNSTVHRSSRLNSPTRQHRPAFSMVESVVATFLVGMVVVAALQSLGASLRSYSTAEDLVRAEFLAGQLLAELSTFAWTDPDDPATAGTIGLDSGDPPVPLSRSQLDDLDDFDGWVETPPKDADGVALTGMNGWSRNVTVENISPGDGSTTLSDNDDQGLRRVVVTVLLNKQALAVVESLYSRDESTLMADPFELSAVPE